jgi:hypothetical protein
MLPFNIYDSEKIQEHVQYSGNKHLHNWVSPAYSEVNFLEILIFVNQIDMKANRYTELKPIIY